MGAYSYTAFNGKGQKVKGVLEGNSERQIRNQLREKGLNPVAIGTARTARSAAWVSRLTTPAFRLSQQELAMFTRQLSTLILSGMPLAEALWATANQCRKQRLKSLFLEVRAKVMEGHTLAYALGEYPAAFDELYRATVSAGERAGYSGQVLERLADYIEARQVARQKIRMAMVYPCILVGVAVAVIAALMVFVVPELIRIFAHANTALPLLTRILIAVSDYLSNYGLVSLAVILVVVTGLKWLLKKPGWTLRWHRLLLRIPLVAALIRSIETARFASTLSILMSSSVPLLEALKISGEVMSNRILQAAARRAAARVEEGTSLNKALDQTGEFPMMMVHMIASGEASGTLEKMLDRAASNQEREQEMALQTLLAVFEPLLIVFMGGMVLLIVLAVLMPIFDLNKLVG